MSAEQQQQVNGNQLSKELEGLNIGDERNQAVSSTEVETFADFDSMGLKESLLRGIYGYGFEKPSIIQQKVRPALSLRFLSPLSFFL